MRNTYYQAGHPNVNLEIVIDANINETAKLSRSEFLQRIQNLKSIRTSHLGISFYLDDNFKLTRLLQLHRIVNSGNFTEQTFSRNHLFCIGIPRKLYSWLKNINASLLYKQILHWHAAYYAFNFFQEFEDREFDPLVQTEVMKILKEYYPTDYKEKFNIGEIDNLEEFKSKEEYALEHYFSVSEKYTGALPPEFLKNPYRYPESNLADDDNDWGVISHNKFSINISYFTELDWIIIVELSKEKLKEFHRYSFEKEKLTKKAIDETIDEMIEDGMNDTMERSESDDEMWQKWKYTFQSFEITRDFTYSLIPNEKITTGFIYLFQTESKEATKIGWTTRPSEYRKSGVQTGNHEVLIERGHFKASGRKTEDVLHKMFEHKHTRQGGEWFHLAEEEIENILNPEWRMSNNIF